MKKNIFLNLLVLVSIVALAACQPKAPAVEEAVVEPYNIAFFVPWTEDIWYVAAINGAQEAADELGINLQVYDAGY
ncbi:MAG: hypothetical protein MUO76_04755, partial [Anaerolineaceae bacterium]|nr:hypothetical protein [Anaerolineaceae bacterium]